MYDKYPRCQEYVWVDELAGLYKCGKEATCDADTRCCEHCSHITGKNGKHAVDCTRTFHADGREHNCTEIPF